MKTPEECQNMSDIRLEIDSLDKKVITLIAQRLDYVKAAVKFKAGETSVKAPERFKAMLAQRRVWAVQEGLDPDVIEKLYHDLVNHFIKEELRHWKAQS